MATLTAAQVYAYARSGGFSATEAVVATAIAAGESGFRTDNVGDTTITTAKWGPSVGLWQVRSLKAASGTGSTRDATRLTDPAFNARAAYQVYKDAGGKWTPWSVYTSGAYKSHLTQAQGAAMTGVNLPTTATTVSTSTDNAGLLSDLGGAVGGAVGGVASDAIASSLDGIWSRAQPFIVTGGVLVLGLGLIGAGVLVTAWPTNRSA